MAQHSPSTARDLAHTAITGAAMGLAELVPGFSAGTVAYVAGIYTRFLQLIQAVLRLPVLLVKKQGRDGLQAIDWPFAWVLAGAMLTAVFVAAGPVRHLLATAPRMMSAVFFGLVCGAVLAALRNLTRVRRSDALVMIAGAAGVFLLLGAGGTARSAPALWFVFLAGMIAITAWILPGISGSFMLVILGIYPVVVAAVADRNFTLLAVFAAGCVVGIASVVRALTRLMLNHGHTVRVVLIAVMIGSVRALWPWSNAFASTDLQLPPNVLSFVGLMALAAAAATAVIWVADRTPET